MLLAEGRARAGDKSVPVESESKPGAPAASWEGKGQREGAGPCRPRRSSQGLQPSLQIGLEALENPEWRVTPSDFRFNNVHLVSVLGPWSKGAKAKQGENQAASAVIQVTADKGPDKWGAMEVVKVVQPQHIRKVGPTRFCSRIGCGV